MARHEARKQRPHPSRPEPTSRRRSTFLYEEMTWTRAEVEAARRDVRYPVLLHRLGQGGPQSGTAA
jgi:hypothetical protein